MHRYRHATTASWWAQRNFIPPTTEAAGIPRKRCERENRRERPGLQREGVLFQPHQPGTIFRCCGAQTHTAAAAAAASAVLSFTGLPRQSGKNEWPPALRHNQQQLPGQSVQAPNADSFSLKGMFKVVATIFQQIMTELSGTQSEEDRIMAITNILLMLMKQNSL
jgi:hypothetical protein